jgi:hypothetical protein
MVQRKEDILITKKVKSWSYWLVPTASVGLITLLVQLIFSPFSADVFSFNFTLGKLWKGDSPEPIVTLVDDDTPTPQQLPFLQLDDLDKRKRLASLSQLFQDIKPKKISKSLPASSVQTLAKSQYIDLNLDRIDAFIIPSAPAFTQRFINLSKKETLLPGIKDLEPSNFRFGFSFRPSLNHRNLKYIDWSATGSRLIDNRVYTFGQTEIYRNIYDKPILGFSVGVDIYYNKTNRLYFQTGLYYSSMGEQLYVARNNQGSALPAYDKSPMFGSMEPAFQSPEMTSSESNEVIPFTNYYGYFEVPLLVNYKIPSGNSIQFEVQTGISYSYLDHADAVVYDFDTDNYFWIPTSDFALFTKHNINTYAGISVGTLLSPKVEIYLNPQYKYALRSTYSKDYPVNQNQYSLGIRMGVKMNLD